MMDLQPDVKIFNPWHGVESLYEFSYFCCPECDQRWQGKQDFINHAFTKHPQVSSSLIKFVYLT